MSRARRNKPKPVDVDAARDAELRALVKAHPEDADVYADWLEERGDLARAEFLRMQQKIRAMKVSHPKLLERGRALFDLGKTLDPAWIADVTHPPIAGTAWAGRDDDGALVLRFLATGWLNYTQDSGTYENGHWEQVGVTVAMETNAHYADYFGVIIGDVVRGNAHNIVDHKWRWKVTRTEDPDVAPVPDAVNREVHDNHTRTRRAKPKPAKRNKKPAKPLPRKTPLKRKTRIIPSRFR